MFWQWFGFLGTFCSLPLIFSFSLLLFVLTLSIFIIFLSFFRSLPLICCSLPSIFSFSFFRFHPCLFRSFQPIFSSIPHSWSFSLIFSFFACFLSSRSVPPLFSIPFAFPSNSLMFCVIVYISLFSHSFSHLHVSFFLSILLSLSLSLSFSLNFRLSSFFVSISLSLSLSLPLHLSLCLSMSACLPSYGREKRRKQNKNERKMPPPKKRLGGNSRRKSQHTRTRRNRILKRAIWEFEQEVKIETSVNRFAENDWDRGIEWDVYIYIYMRCGVIIWSKFGLLRGYCRFWKFPVWIFVDNDAHSWKVLMTFGDFWVCIAKKNEELVFWFRMGGAFMGVWLSGETGARHKFGQFCSGEFWKGQIVKNLLVYHAQRKPVRSNSWGSKPDTDTDTDTEFKLGVFRNKTWHWHSS